MFNWRSQFRETSGLPVEKGEAGGSWGRQVKERTKVPCIRKGRGVGIGGWHSEKGRERYSGSKRAQENDSQHLREPQAKKLADALLGSDV